MPKHRIKKAPRRAQSHAAGTSLLETLVAVALLSVIAIGIFPLFHRALANNVSGSDSNHATQHARSALEGLLALPYDSAELSMRNPADGHQVEAEGQGHKMTLGELYWDPEAGADEPAAGEVTRHIASGAWVANQDDAKGLVVWRRQSTIRMYSYADISDGIIDVNNPNRLHTQGHPQLFDTPLPSDTLDTDVNFKEEDVSLESLRAGVKEYRVRLMRTH